MQPLVFDGTGSIFMLGTDGSLKFLDQKVNKVTMQMQMNWDKVMGGNSGYAFHYTAKDLEDKVSIEIPRYSPVLGELFQGAATSNGTVTFDETEEFILTNAATTGYTLKNGATFVASSDSVYIKDSYGILTPLARAASAPTAVQYSISAAGVITSNAANEGKTLVCVHKWTRANGTKSSFSGTRRPKPFKFVHRFTLVDDRDGSDVPCQFTVFKALGGGELNTSQERKNPTMMNLGLEIMEPDLTSDNPNRYAAELTFGI